ncbi:zf-HC2 domain-containing protein [Paludisphaera soli]|uniref:zf-HC2 domain-containing protein n=1 Tax=Paludisphaera soli TaxID=2712865 RepID=UPI0013EAA19E|nr:zf-HC2 domain-containing protein [Paludisphaera soli]
MNRTPDETACDWVRHRLPLLTEAEADDAPAPGAESGPARDERLAVEAHLEACADCRGRRDGLTRALGVLAAAAAESPVEPHAPSLWPALQARIEAQDAARARRPGRRRSGVSARGPLERAASRLNGVRDELPLQLAWLGDAAREESPARLRAWFDADRVAVAAALAAAAILALAVGLPLAARHRNQAEARIAAATAPVSIPVLELPLVVAPAFAGPLDSPVLIEDAEPVDLAAVDERSLARNTDPPIQPDAPASGPASTSTPSPAVRFDLERGTPMPPDSRIGKPAY